MKREELIDKIEGTVGTLTSIAWSKVTYKDLLKLAGALGILAAMRDEERERYLQHSYLERSTRSED